MSFLRSGRDESKPSNALKTRRFSAFYKDKVNYGVKI